MTAAHSKPRCPTCQSAPHWYKDIVNRFTYENKVISYTLGNRLIGNQLHFR